MNIFTTYIKYFLTGTVIGLLFLVFTAIVKAETLVIDDTIIEVDGYITVTHQDEDTLYIGGNITGASINSGETVPRDNLIEVNLTNEQVTAWNPQPDGPVHDISLYKDTLFIAGQFQSIGATENKFLAFFDKNDKRDISLDISVDQPVYALARHEDTLYIGGSFEEINGLERNFTAAYNLEDNTITQWQPRLNDTVYEIFIFDNKIYLGGAFTSVNGEERSSLAAFNVDDGMLLDWKPSTDLIITHIEEEDGNIAAIGFALLGDDIIAKRLLLHPATGAIIEETEINLEAAASAELFPQEPVESTTEGLIVDKAKLGFQIPTLADILTFAIRAFFVIAGLAALFFLLLGAFAWVTSGGDADAVAAAQQKIQAAVVGLLMMVAVLAVVWTLEQVIFNRRICLGLSCPVTIPTLLEPAE